MKTWLLLVLLSGGGLGGWQWLTRVRDHNATQAQAQAAARRGRFAEAAYYFGRAAALAGRGGPAPALLLDWAQAQAQAGQLAGARATYARLLAPTVPPALGSAARQQLAGLLARQGQPAQALGLLRQALRLNPANQAARYNYEVLSHYLAGQPPPTPPAGLPPPAPKATPPDSAAGGAGHQPGGGGSRSRPEAAAGAAQPQPGKSEATPASTAGQPGPVPTAPGSSTSGGQRPGAGQPQPLPSGVPGGPQHGLDRRAGGGPGGPGARPGTEAATATDAQLQTQRERLKAMNLSPAQAQQLLDALGASEQQYLQQRPRVRQGPAPAPGQPTW